jgi:hypothetical protein
VRLRPRRRATVVWYSSSGRPSRHGVRETRRPRRAGRIRWWLRTAALLVIIGLMRLARTARRHPRPALSLAGTAVTVAGISLPSEPVLISGLVILLVTLFLPGPASAAAVPCSCRLWAHPLTPFTAPGRHVPPPN